MISITHLHHYAQFTPLTSCPKSPSPQVPPSPCLPIPNPPSLLPFLIVTTILTQSIWIDRTANVGRSRIVGTTEIANHNPNPFHILLLRIFSDAFIKPAIKVKFSCRLLLTPHPNTLIKAQPQANQKYYCNNDNDNYYGMEHSLHLK